MGKVVYVVSAVILGFAIMLLPILLFTPSYQYEQTEAASTEGFSPDLKQEARSAAAEAESEATAVSLPLSLTYAGFVVVLGFIVALGASLYAKRRVSISACRLRVFSLGS